ncbi:helix-turn-helix domain-containing protein [Citromicrobium bathyomarinum]
MTVTVAAARLKVTRAALSNLLNGKAALSPDIAMRFEDAFGGGGRIKLRIGPT